MVGMTLLDRVVSWGLDSDGTGDIYGDERERLRWYEGIAVAASLQWLAIPWAAAVLVWPLGMPSVLPLTVVLVLLVIPMGLCSVYVRGRRVDTDARAWTVKRVCWSVLGSLPYVVFMIGVLYARDPESSTWQGAIVGAVFGAAIGAVATVLAIRRRRRQEALAAARGDED
jgi:Flp pilus assembly protein TadB